MRSCRTALIWETYPCIVVNFIIVHNVGGLFSLGLGEGKHKKPINKITIIKHHHIIEEYNVAT